MATDFNPNVSDLRTRQALQRIREALASGGGGSGVADDATLVTVDAEAGLPNSRRLQVDPPLTLADGGPGGNITIGGAGSGSMDISAIPPELEVTDAIAAVEQRHRFDVAQQWAFEE